MTQLPAQQLFQEAIAVLREVKNYIGSDSDCLWTYYENAAAIHEDIDRYIISLEQQSTAYLDDICTHFVPTSAYQEHSMSNGWSAAYMKLAERFDRVYAAFKNLPAGG